MKFLYPDKRLSVISPTTLESAELQPVSTKDVTEQTSLLFNQSDFSYTYQASASTTASIYFDFGEAVSVDYVFFHRLDWYIRQTTGNLSVTVSADDNASMTSPEDDSFTITSGDLIGNTIHNFKTSYIESLSFTTAYRYYRVSITTTESGIFKLKNVWIGEAFDMGVNAVKPYRINYVNNDFKKLESEEYDFSFQGVSKTKRESFYNEIDKYNSVANIVMWDNDDCYFLGENILYGSIIESDYNVTALEDYDLRLKVRSSL